MAVVDVFRHMDFQETRVVLSSGRHSYLIASHYSCCFNLSFMY